MPPTSTRTRPIAKPRTRATPVPPGPSTEASGWKPFPLLDPGKKNQKKKNKDESLEPVPTPEALIMSDWEQVFDLRSDRRKVLFGIGLASLGDAILILIYMIISCCCLIRRCCKKKYSTN